ncbi:Molybdopterin synthase catalytic subunit MoaE [hydrothermal vent metagenome]|uniref:Molybdopterin synthase catalytic subunit MoaE n=1 Tax=hydrothermal vent metagenome TaxID=652676 RepID=A0A3B0TCJ9_9ZZZZ
MSITVRLQAEIFDPGKESNAFLETAEKSGIARGTGAMVTFTGLVRSCAKAPIISMTLEHYPPLAQAQLTRFAQKAIVRFDLFAIAIIHRFGEMKPGEPIVQVMALAPHRRAAFGGAEFVMDFLKTDAPFWKKELSKTGASWVAAKSNDDDARARWQ